MGCGRMARRAIVERFSRMCSSQFVVAVPKSFQPAWHTQPVPYPASLAIMDNQPRRSAADATLGEIEAVIAEQGATSAGIRRVIATLLREMFVEDSNVQASDTAMSGRISG